MAKSLINTSPAMNPPMCAAYATPPPPPRMPLLCGALKTKPTLKVLAFSGVMAVLPAMVDPVAVVGN